MARIRDWIGEHGPTVVGGSLAGVFTYVIWGAVDQGQATCTGYFCEAGPILFGEFIAPVVVLAIVWAVIGIGSYRGASGSLGAAALGCAFGGLVIGVWLQLNYGSPRPPLWYCAGAGIAGIAAAIALIDGPARLRLGAGAGVGACLLTIAIGAVAGPVYNGGFASFRDILLRPSPARFTVIAGVAYPTEGYVLLKVVATGGNDPVALIESRRPDVWDPPDRCGAPMGRSDPSEVQPCEPYDDGGISVARVRNCWTPMGSRWSRPRAGSSTAAAV